MRRCPACKETKRHSEFSRSSRSKSGLQTYCKRCYIQKDNARRSRINQGLRMKGFWITFTDASQGYCEGESEYDAKMIAEKFTGKKVGGGEYKNFTMKSLPYPAKPVIWQFDHPVNGKCPPFCYKPVMCAGKTSCPQNYACSE